MIDAQAVELAGAHKLEREAMCHLEHGLILHAQRRKIIDVKEAPVVDLVRGDAPGGEAIGLRIEQLVQRVRACRAVAFDVKCSDGCIDGLRDTLIGSAHRRQAALVHFLIAISRGRRFRRRLVSRGQMAEACDQALKLGARLGRQRIRCQTLQRGLENARIGARIERQAVFVIIDGEGAALALEARHKLAALEHAPVGGAEHRHQELARKGGIGRLPVDVKEGGVQRCGPVLEHVHPPGIVGAHDADVIGHDIEDMAHTMRTQRLDEALEIRAIGDLGVERIVIDHVIAVCAAGARAKVRRAVDVAHAKAGKIRNDRGCIAQREAGVQLQAVGGARKADAHLLRRRCVTAAHSSAPGAR